MRVWDAKAYDRVSTPQFLWGVEVLEQLPLRGDETVVDAGCGSGRVTAELLRRLPHGRVIAVDASAEMVGEAERRLASEFGERVQCLCQDLCELSLQGPADGIFSTATFHWIPERERLYPALFRALKPGGWLTAQCGGGANLARFWDATGEVSRLPAYRRYYGDQFQRLQTYLDPQITRQQMQDAGFVDVEVWWKPSPVTFKTMEEFVDFTSAVNLSKHTSVLPEELVAEFLRAVGERCGRTLDYVRLNISGNRPR